MPELQPRRSLFCNVDCSFAGKITDSADEFFIMKKQVADMLFLENKVWRRACMWRRLERELQFMDGQYLTWITATSIHACN